MVQWSLSVIYSLQMTLIFCKDSVDQKPFLCWILAWFEALLGLRINLVKSVIFPIGNVVSRVPQVAELGGQSGSLRLITWNYLGSKSNSSTIWNNVEERFMKRLALRQRQYISEGGKLTLIRSTLSSLPT